MALRVARQLSMVKGLDEKEKRWKIIGICENWK